MKKIFCERLREARGLRSQAECARSLGVAQQTYGSWESGAREPNLEAIASISLHFVVSADWLLGLPHAEAPAALPPSPSAEVARLWALVESQQRVIENLSRSPHAGSRQSASGAGEANGGVA